MVTPFDRSFACPALVGRAPTVALLATVLARGLLTGRNTGNRNPD